MLRWAVNIDAWNPSDQELATAASYIEPAERTRITKFHFRADAKRALVGRLLLRCAAYHVFNAPHRIRTTGAPWDAIVISRTPAGKPVLTHPVLPSFSFNISHHGSYVALVASTVYPETGIDVTRVERIPNVSTHAFFDSLQSVFTPFEWSTILNAGNRHSCKSKQDMEWYQLHLFHCHWALKESFTKAKGMGLGLDLQRIEFRGINSGDSGRENKCEQDRWCSGSVLASDVDNMPEPITAIKVFLDDQIVPDYNFELSYLDPTHPVSIAYGPVPLSSSLGRGDVVVRPFTFVNIHELIRHAVPLS
ncbi:holo-[acyl-carrier-protein] synthase [Synchytrium endobioticum]|nr:holo-[acyl-carrier-protein] synthase [Synchytrium endobioticum]